jgi:hypothetical protein
MNINKKLTTALVFVLAAGAGLSAQETGAINGVVSDAAGAPLPDVRVAISSPTLLGTRVLTTNARGEYRAPLLPVGYYTVSISKQGWVASRATNVRVNLGVAASQNFTMKPVTDVSATIDVVAESAGVAKTNTTTGVNFSAAQLESLPVVNRWFTGAADFAPGVTYSGGTFSMRGGPTQQTQYRINGIDIKDDYQGSMTHRGTLEDNIEDIQVVLSELHPRFGRALGGSINVITKSGSNSFSGSIRAMVSRPTWKGVDREDSYYGWEEGDDEVFNDTMSREYHITLNGPVVKDRLWFALATRLKPASANDYRVGRPWSSTGPAMFAVDGKNSLYDNGAYIVPDMGDPVNTILYNGPLGYSFSRLDAGKSYHQTSKTSFYEAKLTGLLSQNHTLELAYTREQEELGPRNPYGDDSSTMPRLATLGTQSEVTEFYGVNYRGIIGSNIFVEARYNKMATVVNWPKTDIPGNEAVLVNMGYTIAVAEYTQQARPFGNGINPLPETRGSSSGNFNVKWIADIAQGSHDFDFGFDFYESLHEMPAATGIGKYQVFVGGLYKKNNGGDNPYSDYLFPVANFVDFSFNGQSSAGTWGPAPAFRKFYGEDGPNKNPSYAFYANDNFTLNKHWNGMFGVRFQNSRVKNTDGSELANTNFISPRFQLKYDVNGDGAHVFGLTAARFGTDFQVAFSTNFVTKSDSKLVNYGWNANDYNLYDMNDSVGDTYGGKYGVRFVNYDALTNLSNYNTKVALSLSDVSATYRFLDDLSTPYMDEYTLSYRRQFSKGSSLSFTYANRVWKNQWIWVTEYADPFVVLIKDPSNSGLADSYRTRTDIGNSDFLKRDYQSLEVEFTARLNKFWTMGGSWTVSRLTGNDEGGDQNNYSFMDTSATAAYLNRSLLADRGITIDDVSPYGPLNNNQPQRGRLYAMVQMPVGKGNVSFSWSLRYDSAKSGNFTYSRSFAINGKGNVQDIPFPDGQENSLGPLNVPNRPTAWTYYYNQKRGQFWQGNDTYRCDFKTSFNIPLGLPGWGSRVQMIGDIMVNNLFNTSLTESIRHAFEPAAVGNNQGFRILNTYDYLPGVTNLYGQTHPGVANYWTSPRSIDFSLGLKF